MSAYLKYRNDHANGKCYLIVIAPSKQAKEIVFARQKNHFNHIDICFSKMLLKRKNTQKHLGLFLDAKLNFLKHINSLSRNYLRRS